MTQHVIFHLQTYPKGDSLCGKIPEGGKLTFGFRQVNCPDCLKKLNTGIR